MNVRLSASNADKFGNESLSKENISETEANVVSDRVYSKTRYGGIAFGWFLGILSFLFRDYWKERKRKKELAKKEQLHMEEHGFIKREI